MVPSLLGFVVSPDLLSPLALVPPEVAASVAEPVELAPPVPLSASPVEEVLEPLCEELALDFLVLEDAAFAAACSALVLLGGVISGVLLGVGSDTLLEPQALTPSAANAASASRPERALTAGPCAGRTSGSR